MNRKTNPLAILIGLLALIVALAAPVLAEDNTTSSTRPQTTQTTEQKPTEQELRERNERLQKRKDELKEHLGAVEKTRLQSRCKNSQGLLRSSEGRIKGIETSRSEVYENLVKHLTELSAKLKAKNVDTLKLDADIITLKAKIATFKTDLANYKLAVSDLAGMDCKQDPDAFKASLEQARALQKKLHQSGQEIKVYVKDTIKPLLVTIRQGLAAKEGDNSKKQGEN